MMTTAKVKPFGPKEAQGIVKGLQQPAVFLNMTCDWPARQWSAEHLSACLGGKLIRFRLGRKDEIYTPLFETQCSYLEASLGQFLCWTSGGVGADIGPFSDFPHLEYWAYADYKYIAVLFRDRPSMFEEVMWSTFGFVGRNGRESTLWIGTEGANTPCHLDSYGCNLVLQVEGRKTWHLFPPEDTANMYPTRVPYEESSVFSQVDVLRPDLRRFPAFGRAKSHTVTLHPGQVLFVPRHWWHYVESVDPVTVSINSWIELEADDEARVGEAVTKAVVCALKTTPSNDNTDEWLNPTEDGAASHDDNMQYVNLALQACLRSRRCSSCTEHTHWPRGAPAVKRDSSGQAKKSSGPGRDRPPLTVPFGPHLIPVHHEHQDSQASKQMALKDRKLEPDCAVAPETGHTARPSTDCGVGQDDPQSKEASVHTLQRVPPGGEPGSDSHSCVGFVSGSGIAEDVPEDSETEVTGHTPITTKDLLDCLVHPDVIDHVTRLLLERQRAGHMTTTES